MAYQIYILVIILVVIAIAYSYYKIENFAHSGGNSHSSKSGNVKINFNPVHKTSTNEGQTMKNAVENNVLYSTSDYNATIAQQNKDLTYYDNDSINQSKITEDAYDIVNSLDKIDYGKVKTGYDKCLEQCDGTCFVMGNSGVATCYPKLNRTFDFGTLYKNPTFTYGWNAYADKQKAYTPPQ